MTGGWLGVLWYVMVWYGMVWVLFDVCVGVFFWLGLVVKSSHVY